MPAEHVLISTQIRCETGPTVVGDSESDSELMRVLDAIKVYRLGNTFAEYITDWTPRRVLDRLSEVGFTVCGMTGAGQTVIWMLSRERRGGEHGTDEREEPEKEGKEQSEERKGAGGNNEEKLSARGN